MTFGRACGIGLACAAWLAAGAALAQREPPHVQLLPTPPAPETAEATAVSPVTVEATKPEELKKQTYSFVQTFAATTAKLDQLARWYRPVCVAVQGLPTDEAAVVKARVEEAAKALKVGAQGRGCNPTIEILFAVQPQDTLDQIAARRPDVLGYDWQRQAAGLKIVSHPIQAWYVTGSEGDANTAGLAFMNMGWGSVISRAGVAGRQRSGEVADDPEENGPTGCGANSRFSACLKSMFEHILVVVDVAQARRFDPGLIADYVTVMALSEPRSLDGCNVLPSVIDLFARGCAGRDSPEGLTRADAAYLTALYKADLEAKKAGEQSEIARRMADLLLKGGANDRLTLQVKLDKPAAGGR